MILADELVAPGHLAGAWTFEPTVVITLAVVAVLYGRGVRRLARRVPRPDRAARTAAFYAGVAVLAVALLSPLDALAEALFSAHMVQHLLLMVVAAPLFAFARPGAALMAGAPPPARDAIVRANVPALRRAARAVRNPLAIWTLGTLALWAWHMPALYDLALRNDAVHAAEHVSFFATAWLFWDAVLASGGPRGVPRPVAILLDLATGVQGTALGAVLLFASSPLYTVHAAGARLWHVSLVHDQQLAGGLMWVPPGFLYALAAAWLLVRWFSEMERASADGAVLAVGDVL